MVDGVRDMGLVGLLGLGRLVWVGCLAMGLMGRMEIWPEGQVLMRLAAR